MRKTFDTINIHTLIRKLLQTNIPGTLIKFIANYIKGRKAYTTYINHTSSQRQFNTGVLQGGVLSPTLFNIYTADIRPPRAPVQVMVYTDDITITLNKKVWICDICHKQIHVRKQISIRCNRIEHWVHLRCAGIRQAQYTDTWTCHLHRESRLTQT